MTFRNKLAGLTGVAVVVAALAACSNPSPEAGHPDTAPPSSASVEPTSTDSVSTPVPVTAPPVRPSAADGLSMSAAEAFLGHYLELLNFAYSTGDTKPLLAASDKGCVGCKGTADYLAKVNGKNGGLSGDYSDRLVEIKNIFKANSGRVGGSLEVQSGNYIERLSPSAPPTQKKAHTESWRFTLSPAGTSWVMYEIQVDE